jgi:hypothetical protein
MRHRNLVGLCVIAVLSSASLLGVGAAAAASGGTAGGTASGEGQAARAGVPSASTSTSVPLCDIKWHSAYTLYEPNGPINWGWRTTAACIGTAAPALSTKASLYWGSLLARAAPTATCQNCTSVTSHGFKSFDFNGAGSWYVKSADLFTVPNIGTDTANGTIVWSFSGGSGKCTEVNANEVRCATTSNAVVVP